jgi:membrane protein implicated in regulation of membrane protease activity
MAMLQELFGLNWGWLTLGAALAIAARLAPGYSLIWLAAAALVTGLVAGAMPVGLEAEVLLFAVLCALALAAAKRWFARLPEACADPMLNDCSGQLVGQSALVTHVIEGGTGRVRRGDTEWLARGPDASPGTRMRITGSEGTVLIVEHLH